MSVAAGTSTARTRDDADIVQTAVAAGQFKTLAKLLTRAGLVATLQEAGPYTVFAGKVTAADVAKLSTAKTLNGKSVRIRMSSTNIFVNSAKVTKADVMASNGVIHVINRVLIPPAR